MSEKVTITNQQATAPSGPTMGVKSWSQLYGTPALTQTVTASVITNPNGFANATITIPLGN